MPDWIFQMIGIAGMCAATYAGVKSDLARAIAKAGEAERCAGEAKRAAERAHERIDGILIKGQ
jgi:hypothetical protein